MNYGVLTLNEGEIVPIIIGKNPSEYTIGNNRNGNTTTFGIYLSATGGEAGNNVAGNEGNGGAGGGGSYYGCGGHGTDPSAYATTGGAGGGGYGNDASECGFVGTNYFSSAGGGGGYGIDGY